MSAHRYFIYWQLYYNSNRSRSMIAFHLPADNVPATQTYDFPQEKKSFATHFRWCSANASHSPICHRMLRTIVILFGTHSSEASFFIRPPYVHIATTVQYIISAKQQTPYERIEIIGNRR